jgi:hypothetical protein
MIAAIAQFVLAAAVIVAAGTFLTRAADAIAASLVKPCLTN